MSDEWWIPISSAVGAFILWIKMRGENRKVIQLTEIIGTFISKDRIRLRMAVESIIFVLLGTVVSFIACHPSTTMQAFSAGLGWTSLTTTNVTKEAE